MISMGLNKGGRVAADISSRRLLKLFLCARGEDFSIRWKVLYGIVRDDNDFQKFLSTMYIT